MTLLADALIAKATARYMTFMLDDPQDVLAWARELGATVGSYGDHWKSDEPFAFVTEHSYDPGFIVYVSWGEYGKVQYTAQASSPVSLLAGLTSGEPLPVEDAA